MTSSKLSGSSLGLSTMLLAAGLSPAITATGAYNPREMSKLLNWDYDEMASYLDVSRSSVEKGLAVIEAQPKLQELAGLYLRLLEAFYGLRDVSLDDTMMARVAKSQATAWLNTPLAALDMKRPKDLIRAGQLDVIRDLIDDADADAAG